MVLPRMIQSFASQLAIPSRLEPTSRTARVKPIGPSAGLGLPEAFSRRSVRCPESRVINRRAPYRTQSVFQTMGSNGGAVPAWVRIHILRDRLNLPTDCRRAGQCSVAEREPGNRIAVTGWKGWRHAVFDLFAAPIGGMDVAIATGTSFLDHLAQFDENVATTRGTKPTRKLWHNSQFCVSSVDRHWRSRQT